MECDGDSLVLPSPLKVRSYIVVIGNVNTFRVKILVALI